MKWKKPKPNVVSGQIQPYPRSSRPMVDSVLQPVDRIDLIHPTPLNNQDIKVSVQSIRNIEGDTYAGIVFGFEPINSLIGETEYEGISLDDEVTFDFSDVSFVFQGASVI